MLIKLERNDLDRVCVPGTMGVDEWMSLETYAHVHHMVSNVSGTLRAQTGPAAVAGCPKLRCIQIISELRQTRHAAYTGSLGHVNRDGDCDFNILLRTMGLHEPTVELRAGDRLVAGSVTSQEQKETRAKARGLLASFQVKVHGP